MTNVKVVNGANECIRPGLHEILKTDLWQCVVGVLMMNGGILLVAFDSHRRTPGLKEYYDGSLCGLQLGQCVQVTEGLSPIAALIGVAERRRIITNGCSVYVRGLPSSRSVQICADKGIVCIYHSDEVSHTEAGGIRVRGIEAVHVDA